MLKVTILRYSFQLVLACSSFTSSFFYFSPLGALLAYVTRGLPTRVRYCLGTLLLLTSYPISYGYILCNTYQSISGLFFSEIKHELSRTVFLLEIMSYLLKAPSSLRVFLCLLDFLNSFFLVRPPREEKTQKEMLLKIKLLLKDYVYRSHEYKAIYRPPREGFRRISLDLYTGLVLANLDNIYSFYAIGLSLLPFPKLPLVIFFLIFFYLLHLPGVSLLLTPFCELNFSSPYLRVLCINLTYYLYTHA